MVFSDTSTKLGIVQDIDFLLFGNTVATSPYLIADKTRNVNRALDETVSLIMRSDARWKWDDDNQSKQDANQEILELYGKGYEILRLAKQEGDMWVQKMYMPINLS